MQQLKQNFKKLDIFGQEIRLLAQGQPAYRTFYGSCGTLILFSMLAYACNTFICDMNQGKNAILNSKEEVISGQDGFILNTSELIFSVGLKNSIGEFIPNDNRRVYNIYFKFCVKTLGLINCTRIPSQICGSEISQKYNIPSQQDKILYCLDEQYIKDNPNIQLSGSTRQENFTLLSSVIERCSNSTDSQTCAPTDEIDTNLKNSYMHFQYNFHQFNKELPNSPYQNTYNVECIRLYKKLKKYVKIYFQYSYSLLEYNPFHFFPIFKEFQGIEFQSSVIDNAFILDNDNSIAEVTLNLDAKKIMHQVTYQTLMDVAAKIGGLFTLLKLFLDICIYPLQFILYRIHLINVIISHRNTINSQSEMVKPHRELSILSIIKQPESRQLYFEQSHIIEQLLDITEILVNPLKITRQVEDLYGSLRRFDLTSSKQANLNINLEIEELVSNNEIIDQRSLSGRSINQEIKFGSSTNFKLPPSQFKKK